MDSALPIKPLVQPWAARKPLVLAVDDDDDNLLLVSYALESFGCKFIGQTEGCQVLVQAKEYQPDLILLDIVLPGVDGFKLAKQLRQEPSTRCTPIIAVTALARKEDRESILRAGFTDYISKPYMLDDLEALIRRYLYQSEQQSLF